MTIMKKAPGRKACCPHCKGSNTHRKGARRTVTLGDRPLRYCTDCRRKFTLHRNTSTIRVSEVPQAMEPVPEQPEESEMLPARSAEARPARSVFGFMTKLK